MNDGSIETVYDNPDCFHVEGIEAVHGKLFFLEINPIDLGIAAELSDIQAGYSYMGERLCYYSPETKETKELPVDRVKRFCKKTEDSFYVFAFDFDMGEFYFSEYNVGNETYSDRFYVENELSYFLGAFAYDSTLDRIIYHDLYEGVLKAINIMAPSEKISFYQSPDGIYHGDDIKCENGLTYMLSGKKITRVKNNSYIKSKVPLRLYSQYAEYYPPSGFGYTLDVESMDVNRMTTAILAGDSDYDMLLLSSNSPLGQQLRRTGAYAPLNDVPNVETYFSESLSFIKEAATADNGTIWMFPYEVDCKVLIYNKERCSEYGIDLEADSSEEALLSARTAVAEAVSNPSYYELNYYQEWSRVLDLYVSDYAVVDGKANFDTELFRRYAKLFFNEYQNAVMEERSSYNAIMPANEVGHGNEPTEITEKYREYYKKVAFGMKDKRGIYSKNNVSIMSENGNIITETSMTCFDFFSVLPLPSLEPEKPQKSVASAYFIVLNPNSKNLSVAKEYLSELAGTLSKEESLGRSKDLKGEYTDSQKQLQEIFRNARIVFALPSDVYDEEFFKYNQGKKTLDEVIVEMNRKLNAYLNE